MDIKEIMMKKKQDALDKLGKQDASSESTSSGENKADQVQESIESKPLNKELEASIKESMQDPNYLGLVPMDSIDLKEQVRSEEDKYSEEELLELALCIHMEGLFKPVVLIPKENGRYDVEQGEHRYLSFDLLRKNETIGGVKIDNRFQYNFIPARKSDGNRVPIRQLKENLFHKSMAPINEAKAIKAAMDEYKWNQEAAAKEFNKTQSWISRRLALLKDEEEETTVLGSNDQPLENRVNESTQNDESESAEPQKPATVKAAKPKPAKKSAKKADEKVVRVPVEKSALHDVCKLLAILSDKHGLGEISIKSNPTNLDIKKTIEQRIAEVLNAESSQ